MKPLNALATLCLLAGWGAAADRPATPAESESALEAARHAVEAVEKRFAQTMADRDLKAFAAFIAEDAVFLNGGKPLRGKARIVEVWSRFFSGPQAPFAWEPDLVEVCARGDLAQSIGPVKDPQGRVVARFYSTWRREGDGQWRIVFDNGYDLPSSQVQPAAAPPPKSGG